MSSVGRKLIFTRRFFFSFSETAHATPYILERLYFGVRIRSDHLVYGTLRTAFISSTVRAVAFIYGNKCAGWTKTRTAWTPFIRNPVQVSLVAWLYDREQMGPDWRYDHASAEENIGVVKECFWIEYFIEDFLPLIFIVILIQIGRLVELVFPSCVFQPRPGRRPRGRPGNATQLHAAPRIQSPISQHLEKGRHLSDSNSEGLKETGFSFWF